MTFRAIRKKWLPTRWNLAARRRWRDSVLARLGLERSYDPPAIIRQPELAVDNVLKYVVAHELREGHDFTFLQVGAYDGVGDDHLRELILRHRLKGVLVEPQPPAFRRLQQTYADQPQVTLLNAAVAERPGLRTLYCPRVGDAMVASFDRAHLIRHGIRPADIVARSVPCYTLAGTLKAAGLARADLLQIDCEGYDFQILDSMDFSVLKPAIIRFEYRHMSRSQADRCIDLLARHGYRFLVERSDIIAHRQRAAPAAAAA